jgi:hypothetical protein
MKKICVVLATIFAIAAFMPLMTSTAYADPPDWFVNLFPDSWFAPDSAEQNSPSSSQTSDSISENDGNAIERAVRRAVERVLNEFFGSREFDNPVKGFTDWVINITNWLWEQVGLFLAGFGNSGSLPGYGITDHEGFAARWSSVFRTFAYGIVILLFGVNFIETALQYEMMTAKGAIKTFGRLLLAKLWVDLSTTICITILQINNDLLNQIVTTQLNNPNINPTVNISSGLESIPIVGEILDTIYGILHLGPLLIMAIAVCVIAVCVLVKLTIRSLEMAMMIVVAPVFFACWVGDATKQYFRKFMTNFIGIVFNIVFMAIVYIAGSEWLKQNAVVDSYADVLLWTQSAFPWFVVVIAMGIMMVKPPRILTSIVE